jgi:multiple sugar transport system ATP-binding protein
VSGGKVYIGDEVVMEVTGVEDQDVCVGIRPEGLEPAENGKLTCRLNNLEVMGRDSSVVAAHDAALTPVVRAIISSDIVVDTAVDTVRFNVKPHKMFLFNKETELRVNFEVKNNG